MLKSKDLRRVAIDRRMAGWREGTGVARYRDGLAAALALLPVRVEAIGDGGDAAMRGALRDLPRILRSGHGAVRAREGWLVPDLYRLAQRHFTLTGSPLEIRMSDPPPLVHWSHPMPLWVAGAANFYTIHDLIPLDTPDLTGMDQRRHARLLRQLARVAAHFVTVSQSVRDALGAHPALAGVGATCCYQAVDPGVPGALPPGLAPGGYLLALGRVESRKNIERLLIAHRRSGVALPLVVAGPEGHWTDRAERARVLALLNAPEVIRLGWQDDATAAALIANARALLMPSLAEGFGLPVVEAMALSVPAVAANRGAGAEIAGDAALRVDPLDIDAMAAAIAGISTDEPLRARLIVLGHDRAAQFKTESFAARLVALYERFG